MSSHSTAVTTYDSDVAAKSAQTQQSYKDLEKLMGAGTRVAPFYVDMGIPGYYQAQRAVPTGWGTGESYTPAQRASQAQARGQQQYALGMLRDRALGANSVVREQSQLGREQISRQIASRMAGQRMTPAGMRGAQMAESQALTGLAAKTNIGVMQERQAAQEALLAGSGQIRQQDIGMFGAESAQEQALRKWKMDKEKMGFDWAKLGIGEKFAIQGSKQDYEKMVESRKNRMIDQAIRLQMGGPESSGTDWAGVASGIGTGVAAAAGIAAMAFSDERLKSEIDENVDIEEFLDSISERDDSSTMVISGEASKRALSSGNISLYNYLNSNPSAAMQANAKISSEVGGGSNQPFANQQFANQNLNQNIIKGSMSPNLQGTISEASNIEDNRFMYGEEADKYRNERYKRIPEEINNRAADPNAQGYGNRKDWNVMPTMTEKTSRAIWGMDPIPELTYDPANQRDNTEIFGVSSNYNGPTVGPSNQRDNPGIGNTSNSLANPYKKPEVMQQRPGGSALITSGEKTKRAIASGDYALAGFLDSQAKLNEETTGVEDYVFGDDDTESAIQGPQMPQIPDQTNIPEVIPEDLESEIALRKQDISNLNSSRDMMANEAARSKIIAEQISDKNSKWGNKKTLGAIQAVSGLGKGIGQIISSTNRPDTFRPDPGKKGSDPYSSITSPGRSNMSSVGAQMISDKGAKEDMDKDKMLSEFLDKMDPVQFNYKDPESHGEGRRTGVIAQDVAASKLGDGMVETGPDGNLMLDTSPKKFNPLVLASLAHLHERLAKLESGKK